MEGNRSKLELTDAQRQIVEENINLVYFYAEKFKSNCPLELDEIVAVMMFGMCKAAATWNPEKSKLSTYATRVMRNELFMRLRQEKKWRKEVYLSEVASKSDRLDDSDESSWEAFLYDKEEKSIEEKAEITVTVEELKQWMKKQEVYMNPTTKKVVSIWIANPQQTQADLAIVTKVSQAQVSRILKRIKRQIIQTFFRGNDQWLYGDAIHESELSLDFMESTVQVMIQEPEAEPIELFPIIEKVIKKRHHEYIQLGFDFEVS